MHISIIMNKLSLNNTDLCTLNTDLITLTSSKIFIGHKM